MIRLTYFHQWLILLSATHLLGVFGCDSPPAESGRTSPTGGGTGTTAHDTGGNTSTASSTTGGAAERQCPTQARVTGPTASKNCTVSVRSVEPLFTCGQPECAVTKALDLTCDTLPFSPALFATSDGAALFTITDASMTQAQVTTVTADGSRVDDVPNFNGNTDYWYAVANSVMTTSSSGKRWFFAADDAPMAIRETESGWVSSNISVATNSGVYVAARMVDDNLGYLTYGIDTESYAPHIMTWDGSCWTDKKVFDEGIPLSSALAVDDNKQPWLAWFSGMQSLYLRNPSGSVQDLFSSITTDAATDIAVTTPIRLLPGGLDGTAAFPMVTARAGDGVRLFSRPSAKDSGWRSALLPQPPESGSTGDGCPSGLPDDNCRSDPCLGSTSCNAHLTATGTGYDVVRTQSGKTFVAWVVYSSQGTYALDRNMLGNEFPTCYCRWTETTGTGTADLMLMHVTEAEPSVSHFRFDMGGATVNVQRDIVLAVRGDTLLVAAQLGGSHVPTLTYIEIDSRQLP